jgi:NADPH:quinone reductase-like Zn-dependent oxidoreductase
MSKPDNIIEQHVHREGPLMAAAQFSRYGGPEVLAVVSVPRPTPGPGEVLVKVAASAVNSHDAVVRSGRLRLVTGRRFPLGLGLDFAGTVEHAGAGVDQAMIGTAVWGMTSPKTGHVTGAAAEYVVVPADRVAAAPTGLSAAEAAALVTSGTTALHALRDVAGMIAGQRILVRGAAGGVGITATQLAVGMGAHVTALASGRDTGFIAGLGAHEILEYTAVRPRQLPRFDVVFDTVGKNLLAWRRRLNPGGRMVTIAFGSAPAMTSIAASTIFGAKRIRTFSNYPDHRLLNDLAAYVDDGVVRPVIGGLYPLPDIAQAHRDLTERTRRGKLVLTITQR